MTAPIIETPRGAIGLNKAGKAELKFNSNFRNRWQRQYSDAQIWMDSEVLRDCEPYTPFRTGTLVKTGILGTDVGSGEVKWIAPYAKYQYYGKVMLGRKPKKVGTKNLTYHGGGKRGAMWFERAKAVKRTAWVKGAKQIAGSG